MFLSLLHAPAGARAVFLTGSGTAGMESAVANVLGGGDRAIVIDGGSFGHRFAELCTIHGIAHERIALAPGEPLAASRLEEFSGKGFTALLVNAHETSTGVLYDMPMIADFCRREGLFLLVDAISAFLADPFDMEALGAGVVITGSQKALACPPGVSMLALSQAACARIAANDPKCLYLDLRAALANAERGQTPFTPAVTTLLQLHARFRQLAENGGAAAQIARTSALASDFRRRISDLPLKIFSRSPSNAVTSLATPNRSARTVFNILKDEFGIWICPNGGPLGEEIFRVGHLGELSVADNETLSDALHKLHERGIFQP